MTTFARINASQHGLLRRDQLTSLGITRDRLRNEIRARRWVMHSPVVVSTFTGELTRRQMMWLGVLHAGPSSAIADLTAAELHGLRNWRREEVRVIVPQGHECSALAGIKFIRTRRDVSLLRTKTQQLPTVALEPAVLMYAARTHSPRSAQGAIAATVQQRLTRPRDLRDWIDQLQPLKRAALLRRALDDIEGGSASLAEIDLARLCRSHGLAKPDRQTKRRDLSGRHRWTDAEWQLPAGHTIVLEVDGAFHMETESWEDDLARQRRLSLPGMRTIVRCTAREVRDEPDAIARDLIALGVPRVVGRAS